MKGYYINLESRGDRREHFEKLQMEWPVLGGIKRLNAIQETDGALGCCCSHLSGLRMLDGVEAEYVAIFEDDFCVLNSENFAEFWRDFDKIRRLDSWDVLALTPRGICIKGEEVMENAGFRRIIENQTATGYIVKKEFMSILIENLAEAELLQRAGVDKNQSSIDQYWKRLQDTHRFYYYGKIFGGQLPSWSDIEGWFVNYNERFLAQEGMRPVV
jgi:glycosyl transferase family 25